MSGEEEERAALKWMNAMIKLHRISTRSVCDGERVLCVCVCVWILKSGIRRIDLSGADERCKIAIFFTLDLTQ